MCRLTALAGIKRSKQVQANWTDDDVNSVSYIKNKPTNLATKEDIEGLRGDLEASVENANDTFATKTSVEGLSAIVQENKSTIVTTKAELDALKTKVNGIEATSGDRYNELMTKHYAQASSIMALEESNTAMSESLNTLVNEFGELREEVWKLHILSGDTFPEESLVGQLFWNNEFNMFGIYNGYAWVDSNGFQVGRHSGYGTGERPDYLNDITDVGYPFFDRDINMMVWWNGSGWFNANGEEV